jgi:tRNA(Ile)-lysidine synthase
MVALSGGSDSTALLIGLKKIATEKNLDISACHVNHRQRGKESDEDESFCRKLCQSLGIDLIVSTGSSDSAISEPARKSEDELRDLRYRLLVQAAQTKGAAYLLTAHTFDDQIETVLLHLLRGTSPRGLAGMKLWRHLSDGIYLIRPLLTLSKQECSRFLLENGVTAREDSSNLDQSYTRNYLRNTIVPAIAARFPNFREQIAQLQQILEGEEDYLAQITAQQLSRLEAKKGAPGNWPLKILQDQPLAIKRRLLAQALRDRGIALSFERIAQIIELANLWSDEIKASEKGQPAALSLNETWLVRLSPKELVWEKANPEPLRQFDDLTLKVPGNNIAIALGRVLKIEVLNEKDFGEQPLKYPHASCDEVLVDLAQAKLPLVLRTRSPGDIIQPLGMSAKVRLKQYLHTHKGSARENEEEQWLSSPRVVLADQEEIIWVPGIGLSEKIKVKDKPSHRISWLPIAPDEHNVC